MKLKASLFYLFLFILPMASWSQTAPEPNIEDFLGLFKQGSEAKKQGLLHQIEENWSEASEIYAIETLYFLRDVKLNTQLFLLLQKKTNQNFGFDFNDWYEYVWNKEPNYTADYFRFKTAIHGGIDPKFKKYFIGRESQTTIRLDEVRWGGVVQDGIPPLRNPKMISALDATYLDDDDIVFGISINGDTRAYPKRILAWHEFFTDIVGDIPIAGVYCTLCGTVIPYKTTHNGIEYKLGTSGFLYRSNKLMYDQKTQSLWNTLWGKPVIGPLVDKGIELEYLSVVTTTWKEWKKLHPETSVLSLKTGFRRDYGEGIAYQDYFSSDELMFNVPQTDRRLKNKQQILAIRLPSETDENIAISSKFLRKNSIYQSKINGKNFTVFTDKSGAHRAFFTGDLSFKNYDKRQTLTDSNGALWRLGEDYIEHSETGQKLERLHTFSAFWFGYKAAFPTTTLVK